MKKLLQGKLTYANVVATIALFIAVGGASAFAATQLAKNSVGTKQLKKNAVTGAKVKNGSISAADIAGAVKEATKATTATNADRAANATNADQLGGSPAAAFKDKCPAGTTPAAGRLCTTETIIKTSGYFWEEQIQACAAAGMRLPSTSEAILIGPGLALKGSFFTDDFYEQAGERYAAYYDASTNSIKSTNIEGSGFEGRVCVTTPSNS